MQPIEETHTFRWVGETLKSIFPGGGRITGFPPMRDSENIHGIWQGYVVDLDQVGSLNGPALFKIFTGQRSGMVTLEFMGNSAHVYPNWGLPEQEAMLQMKHQTNAETLELMEPWVA